MIFADTGKKCANVFVKQNLGKSRVSKNQTTSLLAYEKK